MVPQTPANKNDLKSDSYQITPHGSDKVIINHENVGSYPNYKSFVQFSITYVELYSRLPSIMHRITGQRCQSADSFAQYTVNSSHHSIYAKKIDLAQYIESV